MSNIEELRRISQDASHALWAAEAEEKDRHNASMVGKCFRYQNGDGSGEKWWLYARIIGTKKGSLYAFRFQTTAGHFNGEIRIEPNQFMFGLDGWEQISSAEFAHAWQTLSGFIAGVEHFP